MRKRRWSRVVGWGLVGLTVVLLAAVSLTIGWRPIVGPRARALDERRYETTPERLARGRYMVEAVSGCLHCHSELEWSEPGFPIRPGTEGSGRSWADEGLPFVSASNITPDPDTGAGTWTDDMLARAIREGIGHDGRALFPLMPYTQYRHMSDEDLAAVIVYLRTLAPVRKALPPSEVPFPVNRVINVVPELVTEPVVAPPRGDRVAYGEYLVRMGACRDCHTPADAQGNRFMDMDLAGGFVLPGPYGQVASTNLTPAPSGIPYYTEDLFLEVMRTGMVRARDLHDVMPVSIYRNQTDEDLRAMFAYLETLAPVAHRVDNSLPPTLCALCGAEHGAGEMN